MTDKEMYEMHGKCVAYMVGFELRCDVLPPEVRSLIGHLSNEYSEEWDLGWEDGEEGLSEGIPYIIGKSADPTSAFLGKIVCVFKVAQSVDVYVHDQEMVYDGIAKTHWRWDPPKARGGSWVLLSQLP